MLSTVTKGVLASVLSLFVAAAAHAQAFRTYLASTGADNPTCSRASPCRLLPAALAATVDGGEVWILDSANYNAATVSPTKSVTILAVPGAVGSLVSTGGGAAINIATPGLKVTLRNLVLVPLPGGSATSGLTVAAPGSVTVDGCLLAGFPSFGIVTGADVNLHVTDSTIRDNGDTGIWLLGGTKATIARTVIKGNAGTGVFVISNFGSLLSRLDIANSVLSANGNGVLAWSETTADVLVSIKDSQIVRNSNVGVETQSTVGSNVWVTVSGNVISNNLIGVRSNDQGSKVLAFGNTVSGNGAGFVQTTGVFETSGHNTVRNNGMDTSGTITPVSTL